MLLLRRPAWTGLLQGGPWKKTPRLRVLAQQKQSPPSCSVRRCRGSPTGDHSRLLHQPGRRRCAARRRRRSGGGGSGRGSASGSAGGGCATAAAVGTAAGREGARAAAACATAAAVADVRACAALWLLAAGFSSAARAAVCRFCMRAERSASRCLSSAKLKLPVRLRVAGGLRRPHLNL